MEDQFPSLEVTALPEEGVIRWAPYPVTQPMVVETYTHDITRINAKPRLLCQDIRSALGALQAGTCPDISYRQNSSCPHI